MNRKFGNEVVVSRRPFLSCSLQNGDRARGGVGLPRSVAEKRLRDHRSINMGFERRALKSFAGIRGEQPLLGREEPCRSSPVAGDNAKQAAAPGKVIAASDVFVTTTVILESEWVLRPGYILPPKPLRPGSARLAVFRA